MPVYDYRCGTCKTEFDEYLSTSTAPAPPCPSCGGSDVDRQWSSFGTKWKPSFIKWNRMGSWGAKPPKKNF
jgi:putative FmdB family regulatory protein